MTALDDSEEMLKATQEHIEHGAYGGSVSYQLGDIASLPFESGTFDLAWASRTVHHLPDQLAGVRELTRVITPGGKLVLREGVITIPSRRRRPLRAWTRRSAERRMAPLVRGERTRE